ncbi:MAG: FAD-linked oxidase C-terminal domain-containing protein [Bacillota bacterium]
MDKNWIQDRLKQILGPERVLAGELNHRMYSYDSSFLARLNNYIPDAVAFPASTGQVAEVMKFAWANNIPVTPRGAGTGETCGCVAVRGGIVLDLSPWDKIEEVDTANMQALVRPGVIHASLNEHLESHGLFFPPDPGSSRMCTLGGMVANNSSGLRAVKYGTTEHYVLGLEVVLPDGEVIITGGAACRAIKNVSGLNLTQLFTGSEGVLGVITLIRLRLWPRPGARGMIMAQFRRLADATPTVLEVYRGGILPSGVEILDDSAIRAVNLYYPEAALPEEAEAILLFEVDGNPASVQWEGEQIAAIAGRRAIRVEWATEKGRMAGLWQGRSLVAAAAARLQPGSTRIFAGEDICVPLSRVAEALEQIKALGQRHGIAVVNFGHIGDGNIHTAPVIDPRDRDQVARAARLVDEIHRLAIRLGGSTTGEHGVGAVRSCYAREEHGAALDTMLKVKRALDPKNIMNPGKIFPGSEGEQV